MRMTRDRRGLRLDGTGRPLPSRNGGRGRRPGGFASGYSTALSRAPDPGRRSSCGTRSSFLLRDPVVVPPAGPGRRSSWGTPVVVPPGGPRSSFLLGDPGRRSSWGNPVVVPPGGPRSSFLLGDPGRRSSCGTPRSSFGFRHTASAPTSAAGSRRRKPSGASGAPVSLPALVPVIFRMRPLPPPTWVGRSSCGNVDSCDAGRPVRITSSTRSPWPTALPMSRRFDLAGWSLWDFSATTSSGISPYSRPVRASQPLRAEGRRHISSAGRCERRFTGRDTTSTHGEAALGKLMAQPRRLRMGMILRRTPADPSHHQQRTLPAFPRVRVVVIAASFLATGTACGSAANGPRTASPASTSAAPITTVATTAPTVVSTTTRPATTTTAPPATVSYAFAAETPPEDQAAIRQGIDAAQDYALRNYGTLKAPVRVMVKRGRIRHGLQAPRALRTTTSSSTPARRGGCRTLRRLTTPRLSRMNSFTSSSSSFIPDQSHRSSLRGYSKGQPNSSLGR